MYPGCTWADQPVTATTSPFGIGTAAVVEPRTGLTTRYTVHAYDPHTRSLHVAPDAKEGPAGAVRAIPAEQRARRQTLSLDGLDDVQLTHRRDRDDLALMHDRVCRHVIKASFTAGGDRDIPPDRRVYRFRLETTQGTTYRFLVRARSEQQAATLTRNYWQGAPPFDGYRSRGPNRGERIDWLTCEGARDMPVWPYPEPIAVPV
jgi:hypothetical protein